MDEKVLSDFALCFAKAYTEKHQSPANSKQKETRELIESIRDKSVQISELNKVMKRDIEKLSKLMLTEDKPTKPDAPPLTPEVSAKLAIEVLRKKAPLQNQKKRMPSAYNIFVGEEISRLNKSFPDMTKGERMKKANAAWKLKKKQTAELDSSSEEYIYSDCTVDSDCEVDEVDSDEEEPEECERDKKRKIDDMDAMLIEGASANASLKELRKITKIMEGGSLRHMQKSAA
jgi:hypothetical protein